MSISAETHLEPTLNIESIGTSAPGRTRDVSRSHKSITDEQLVCRARRGNAAAYGQLYQRYHPYIRKILGNDVSDIEARNDILQTVFERGWSKLGSLRDPKAFRPWLAQLTRRLVIDHYRSASRTVSTDFTDPDEGYALASDDWTAHDWAAMNELAATLQIGIDRLSPRDATVLEMAIGFGFTSREIATALDIDLSHTRVLLHRARRRLSRELAASLEGCPSVHTQR